MNQLAGRAGRTAGPVAALDQRDLQTTLRGIIGAPGAVDAAADNQQIKGLLLQPLRIALQPNGRRMRVVFRRAQASASSVLLGADFAARLRAVFLAAVFLAAAFFAGRFLAAGAVSASATLPEPGFSEASSKSST